MNYRVMNPQVLATSLGSRGWYAHLPNCLFNPYHGCLTYQDLHVYHQGHITAMDCSASLWDVPPDALVAFCEFIESKGWK